MRSTNLVLSLGALSAVVTAFVVSPVSSSGVRAANQAAAPLNCNLSEYKGSTGLTSAVEGNVLTVSWNGQGTSQLRARFAIDGGTPTIRDLSVRRGSGEWAVLGQNLTPEYQVTTARRRMSNDQANAFASLGIDVTPELLEKHKWYAFWDAPLSVPGYNPAPAGAGGRGGGRAGAPAPDAGAWDRAEPLKSRSRLSSRVRAADLVSTRARIRQASPAAAVSRCRGRRKKSVAVSRHSRRHRARSRAMAAASR